MEVSGQLDKFKPAAGNERLHEIFYDNEIRVANFGISKDLIFKSIMFPYPNIHKYTWNSDVKTIRLIMS
jgi:hypothetical protein